MFRLHSPAIQKEQWQSHSLVQNNIFMKIYWPFALNCYSKLFVVWMIYFYTQTYNHCKCEDGCKPRGNSHSEQYTKVRKIDIPAIDPNRLKIEYNNTKYTFIIENDGQHQNRFKYDLMWLTGPLVAASWAIFSKCNRNQQEDENAIKIQLQLTRLKLTAPHYKSTFETRKQNL